MFFRWKPLCGVTRVSLLTALSLLQASGGVDSTPRLTPAAAGPYQVDGNRILDAQWSRVPGSRHRTAHADPEGFRHRGRRQRVRRVFPEFLDLHPPAPEYERGAAAGEAARSTRKTGPTARGFWKWWKARTRFELLVILAVDLAVPALGPSAGPFLDTLRGRFPGPSQRVLRGSARARHARRFGLESLAVRDADPGGSGSLGRRAAAGPARRTGAGWLRRADAPAAGSRPERHLRGHAAVRHHAHGCGSMAAVRLSLHPRAGAGQRSGSAVGPEVGGMRGVPGRSGRRHQARRRRTSRTSMRTRSRGCCPRIVRERCSRSTDTSIGRSWTTVGPAENRPAAAESP